MFPTLQTDKFILRQIVEADMQKIFEGLSDPQVIRYYGVSYYSLEEVQKQLDWYNSLLIQQTGIWWGICFPHLPDSIIGACGFNEWKHEHKRTELGYWLLPPYWHKGVMSECIPAIIKYAFTTMQMHRIEAVVEAENELSSRLLSKLGFAFEGTHLECEIKNGRYIDLSYYALLNKHG
jgi:ribosomal-protein-alanine N-acetyltransferase